MIPTKLIKFRQVFKRRPFVLLDLGAGNYSASTVKKYFPECKYYGLDIVHDYNYRPDDFSLMEKFWEMDITRLEFDDIPDNYFDALLMAHIIEHLHNGDDALRKMSKKLKAGGYIYIEYPSAKSVNFPSKKGTLNFYDDPTHVRLFTLNELTEILTGSGFEILDKGIRRDWRNILLFPLKLIHNRIKYGYVMGSVYWDIYGFAEYVWARKKG